IPLPSRGEFDGDGPGKSMTTLVGRDRELDALRGIWEQALGGQSRLSFVAGEPGIGKTTLVNALVEAITRSDTRHHVSVARGFCVEHHGHGEPSLPFLEAIEDLVAASERRTLLAMLRRCAPTWLVQLPWRLHPAEGERLEHSLNGTTAARMLREGIT